MQASNSIPVNCLFTVHILAYALRLHPALLIPPGTLLSTISTFALMQFIAIDIKADLYLILHCVTCHVFYMTAKCDQYIQTDRQTDRQRGREKKWGRKTNTCTQTADTGAPVWDHGTVDHCSCPGSQWRRILLGLHSAPDRTPDKTDTCII